MTTTVPSLTLRPVEPADRDFLVELYAQSRAGELAVTGWTPDQQRAFLAMQFTAQDTDYRRRFPRASFDVVLYHAARAGRLYVDRRPDAVHVLDILVADQYRGLGLGTALMGALIDEAAATDRPVTLYVEQHNPARSWYERLGFAASGDTTGVYLFMSTASS